MINTHLNILHLFPTTDDAKVNAVAEERQRNLLKELAIQGITDYSLIGGFYDPINTKKAIHAGHRRIVELAKAQGHSECLISEDDIKFSHPDSFKYFISQIPKSYDVFAGLVYSAEMEGDRVKNGGSGLMTLYVVNNRFYDFFLSMDVNNHVDREVGLTAYKHEYYVCQPMVCEQRGGHSIQMKRSLFYGEYLRDIKLYGVDYCGSTVKV